KIEAELESMRPALASVDSTLLGALDTSLHKMTHQVDALETKYVNAVSKRSEVMERHLDAIVNSIFPGKKLQERLINITSFLARYVLGIIDRFEKSHSIDTREHQVIEV